MKSKNSLILALIIIMAFAFRIIGLNWDQNQHLHPDERFLTMVGMSMEWPNNFRDYLNTETSKLNPHNIGYNFYVYGTFPVIFVKAVAQLFSSDNYNGLTLVGRVISAILDVGITLLTYLIAKSIFKSTVSGIWAAFLYSGMVLPIQLSHFFAVDTYLVFFLVLSFYLLTLLYQKSDHKVSYFYALFLGTSLGMALSSKVSGAISLPIFALLFTSLVKKIKILKFLILGLIVFISMAMTLRVAYPYLFFTNDLIPVKLNPAVLANWKELENYSKPNLFYPPATMWISSTMLSPLQALFYWGLGIPLSLIFIFSVFFVIKKHRHQPLVIALLSTILIILIYQTFQFAKPLRYYYPSFAFLAVLCGHFIYQLKINRIFKAIFIIIFLLWPCSFISIYLKLHSRIQASNWIYDNLPEGSTLSCDYWDDCLPLPFESKNSSRYAILEYHLYDKDSPEKWYELSEQISKTDYLLLTSNRLYASITSIPQYYPTSSHYYKLLFSEKLGFTKINEFTSRPQINIPYFRICLIPPGEKYGIVSLTSGCNDSGFQIIDDYAEETFTVYDHPKVIIFKNNLKYSASEIYQLITKNTL